MSNPAQTAAARAARKRNGVLRAAADPARRAQAARVVGTAQALGLLTEADLAAAQDAAAAAPPVAAARRERLALLLQPGKPAA